MVKHKPQQLQTYLHYTLLPILTSLLLITWATTNDLRVAANTLILVLITLLSILLHELGHGLVALASKRSATINILPFGGYTTVADAFPSQFQHLLFLLAGPVANIAAAGVSLLASLTTATTLSGALQQATQINLILAAFNLLPLYPLDGSRILQVILRPIASYVTAAKITSGVSILIATILLVSTLTSINRLAPATTITILLFLLLAMTLTAHHLAETRRITVLLHNTVGELAAANHIYIDPATVVTTRLYARMLQTDKPYITHIRGQYGHLNTSEIIPAQLPNTAHNVAQPLPSLHPKGSALTAVNIMRQTESKLVVVTDGTQIIGTISIDDLI